VFWEKGELPLPSPEVRRALEAGSPVEQVIFCCFSAEHAAVYVEVLDAQLPASGPGPAPA
jgi:hypothetical protein